MLEPRGADSIVLEVENFYCVSFFDQLTDFYSTPITKPVVSKVQNFELSKTRQKLLKKTDSLNILFVKVEGLRVVNVQVLCHH